MYWIHFQNIHTLTYQKTLLVLQNRWKPLVYPQKKIAKDLQINTSDITLTYQSKWKKESKGKSNRENKKMDERRCAEKNQMPH